MKKLIPRLVGFAERWLLDPGWRRALMIGASCTAYVAFHVAAFLSGGFAPLFFTLNFFLIVLCAASLGVWGGLAAATLSGIAWGPFAMFFISAGHGSPNLVWIVRFLVLELFGLITGTVVSVFRYQIRVQRETDDRLVRAQKLEALGRLAGGIAHDFNNMLTAIGGYAELLAHSASADLELNPIVAELRDVIGRSAKLTQQLLAISRHKRMDPLPLDLDEEIQSFAKILDRVIGDNIRLELSYAAQSWKVEADPVQIDQVIMNLVVNAVDAMPDGGRLAVRTECLVVDSVFASQHPGLEIGEYVIATVSDTGVGIDRETAAHLFEPFFTTKAPGKGTGLGLSTSYGIVKQLKGDLWFTSEPGRGSSFKICLPRARAEATRQKRRSEVTSSHIRPADSTVLVAEDNESVRSVIARLLRSEGFTVISAGDGEEALRVIRDEGRRVDLLLTDVVMPKRTGVDVIETVYRLRPTMGVIVMSGYARDEREHMEITVFADRFLEKPFTGEQLLTTVRQLIG